MVKDISVHSSNIYTTILQEITVLYVEDDFNTQKIISEILMKFCSNVKLAANGKEALEIFNKNKIDLIITDIEMPQMNGIELIEELRAVDKNVAVIILSAYSNKEYLFSGINLKIESYILKPISYTKLKNALFGVAQMINESQKIYIKISENLFYDSLNGYLIQDKQEIGLQKKEKVLMDLLVQSKGSLVLYDVIEKALWSDFNEVMTPTALRTVVKKLRKKSDQTFIQNVSGSGYKLVI